MEQEHKQGELSIGNFQKYPVLLKEMLVLSQKADGWGKKT